MTLQTTETINNINELQASGKLNSHVRTGLVPSTKLKAWYTWYDVKYEIEINKVSKTEAVKRVAAMEGKDPAEIWRRLSLLK